MKAITWLAAVTVGVAALTSSTFAATAQGWSTDLKASIELAKKEKKSVLINFTGSDWCPPCVYMHKNVFDKKEFVDAASKQFVLVELDLPNGDKELKEKNKPFAKEYEVIGFPTIILLDEDGKEFSRFFGNEFPSIETFLAKLDKSIEYKDLD